GRAGRCRRSDGGDHRAERVHGRQRHSAALGGHVRGHGRRHRRLPAGAVVCRPVPAALRARPACAGRPHAAGRAAALWPRRPGRQRTRCCSRGWL
ncbi:hypothetical protein IWQ56_007544, partial [Coemansia nantahalensis]